MRNQGRRHTKSDLTFARTLEIAEVADLERAKRDAAELHVGISEVHKIRAHNPKRSFARLYAAGNWVDN